MQMTGMVFQTHSKIYVDKTGLIACPDELINTDEKCICVSRPRCFEKPMTLKMLAFTTVVAVILRIYSKGFEIKNEVLRKYLNKYDDI